MARTDAGDAAGAERVHHRAVVTQPHERDVRVDRGRHDRAGIGQSHPAGDLHVPAAQPVEIDHARRGRRRRAEDKRQRARRQRPPLPAASAPLAGAPPAASAVILRDWTVPLTRETSCPSS